MPIDSYRFLDFATRQIMKAWVDRESRATRPPPWAPMAKPLAECKVALVTTAGVSLRDDRAFDQERERRDPWWGDPSFRLLPHAVTESQVALRHMHVATRFGEEDLDVVLPARRLAELAAQGVVAGPADFHYSIMGYQLRPRVLEEETAPAIARDMTARGVDAAALVPA